MADAVVKTTLLDNKHYHKVHLTNVSDGTGEAAVIKIDKSAIGVASDGAEAASLDLVEVRWNVQGFAKVTLLWDHTTDDVAMVLSGSGFENFSGGRSVVPGLIGTPPKPDPRSSGGTGDLLLTAPAGATTGSYDITILVRKQPD